MWMHYLYRAERARLRKWERIEYVRLDGHPTTAQLASGVGKRGGPVSEHNKWCDRACGEQARKFLEVIHA